jgi:hypothetical protein
VLVTVNHVTCTVYFDGLNGPIELLKFSS